VGHERAGWSDKSDKSAKSVSDDASDSSDLPQPIRLVRTPDLRKDDIARVIQRDSGPRKVGDTPIVIGTATDPYQPRSASSS
jgi:hypothetical protein